MEVFTGLLNMSTSTMSSSLGAGKVLERKPGATESASNIQKGIVNDDWDQSTEARISRRCSPKRRGRPPERTELRLERP